MPTTKMIIGNPTAINLFAFLSTMFLHVMFLHSVTLPSTVSASALGNGTDRFALLKFKESISSDPHGILRTWNDTVHLCSWPGIACSRLHQRVTALNLSNYTLGGSISPYLGNLSFLRFFLLYNNGLSGKIPQQVTRLSRLQTLSFYNNKLEGKIPVNLSYCSKLRVLNFGENRLTGSIPQELGSLGKLWKLNLEGNYLTGGVPPSLGNISSLEVFSVAQNNLFGSVPDELGRLKSLRLLSLGPNNFSGTIPPSIYNISSMVSFGLASNQFKGTLPSTIGSTLPKLQIFYIGDNKFSGVIPQSFSNASHLQHLDLGVNNFVGQVPESLGSLQELRELDLSRNNLGSSSPDSLDFIASLTNCSLMEVLDLSTNNFTGVLPYSVANFSRKLSQLYLGGNQISGNIPSALENLANLIVLSLENNLFTTFIPTSLGKLKNLQSLTLNVNLLSGKLPSSIGNLTQLFRLDLSDNKLGGSIPTKIADCHNLQILDMSNNRLTGEIPREIFLHSSLSILLNMSQNLLTGDLPADVGKLKNINTLDLSENNLTGKIPETIGDCQILESLHLQGNFFQQTLSSTLGSLRGIQYLDFSRNNLTGQIQKDLQKLPFLLYLNLSFNDLEGEVPNEGVFQNMTAVSLVGNTKLCGGVPQLHLQACPQKKFEKGKTNGLKITIISDLVVAFSLLSLGIVTFLWRKSSQRKTTDVLPNVNALSQISYERLFQATNGFSQSMLIGIGSFGSVYKGITDGEESPVAIKVFNLQRKGANKSFIAECNALRNVRHRNVVKILTCCSSVDYKGNEFKALVFEYMSNGSLEKWLYLATDSDKSSRCLNLLQRLNIAVDVASAIHYLHDHCDQPIIHCDLKPSNVLLDNEMVAHVSDFGLARLVSNRTSFSIGQSGTIGMKGTIGYVAPEYAMGGEPSREGDVYSYGVLVLELFTGKRPTDEIFKDDFNLHNFVKMDFPERLRKIVDSALLPREAEENELIVGRGLDSRNYSNNTRDNEIDTEKGLRNQSSTHLWKCLVSVLEIGIACSKESPNERMKMGHATRELQHIRNVYMSFENSRQK